jgi:hypothetical protein
MTYSKELHNELKRLYEKATDLPWVNMTDDTFFGEIRTAGGEHFTEIADMPHLDDRTAQEWVSVSERLPEEQIKVLVYGDGEFMLNSIQDGRWYLHMNVITHWQEPLPPTGETK